MRAAEGAAAASRSREIGPPSPEAIGVATYGNGPELISGAADADGAVGAGAEAGVGGLSVGPADAGDKGIDGSCGVKSSGCCAAGGDAENGKDGDGAGAESKIDRCPGEYAC